MPKYFDIHSHLNFLDYEKDIDEIIKRLKETETHTIVVGTDFESSQMALGLADKYEEIYACIGVHPVDNPNRIFEREKFEELIKHPKVVAVGECGLDFYHPPAPDRAGGRAGAKKEIDFGRQKKLFLDQIDFAIAHNKPLMIHARDAYEELLKILELLKKVHGEKLRGNIHFFAGDVAIAKRLFDIGFTISFTGVITFSRDYDEVIKVAPLNMIMSETDAPFVAPAPYRGKRNEPSYVSEVVAKIAEVRGEDLELVRTTLVNNVLSMIS